MAVVEGNAYAKALMELGLEREEQKQLYREALFIQEIWNREPDFRFLLRVPLLSKEDKKEVLDAVFPGNLSASMKNFLSVLEENGRSGELDSILEDFIRLSEDVDKIGTASVWSAIPLSDFQKERLEGQLGRLSGYRCVKVSYELKPELLGGMVIRTGGREIDGSIKTQLDKLEHYLKES